jgi:hypothetical protein
MEGSDPARIKNDLGGEPDETQTGKEAGKVEMMSVKH